MHKGLLLHTVYSKPSIKLDISTTMAVAVLAYEALKDTHTEHSAALGANRG